VRIAVGKAISELPMTDHGKGTMKASVNTNDQDIASSSSQGLSPTVSPASHSDSQKIAARQFPGSNPDSVATLFEDSDDDTKDQRTSAKLLAKCYPTLSVVHGNKSDFTLCSNPLPPFLKVIITCCDNL
jgi:hypothetical protein